MGFFCFFFMFFYVFLCFLMYFDYLCCFCVRIDTFCLLYIYIYIGCCSALFFSFLFALFGLVVVVLSSLGFFCFLWVFSVVLFFAPLFSFCSWFSVSCYFLWMALRGIFESSLDFNMTYIYIFLFSS